MHSTTANKTIQTGAFLVRIPWFAHGVVTDKSPQFRAAVFEDVLEAHGSQAHAYASLPSAIKRSGRTCGPNNQKGTAEAVA